MLDVFSARLEARNAAKGHFRSYIIEAGTDLFDDWLVEVTFGRIGSKGCTLRYALRNEEEARAKISSALRDRSTAYKRLGARYELRETYDPLGWLL